MDEYSSLNFPGLSSNSSSVVGYDPSKQQQQQQMPGNFNYDSYLQQQARGISDTLQSFPVNVLTTGVGGYQQQQPPPPPDYSSGAGGYGQHQTNTYGRDSWAPDTRYQGSSGGGGGGSNMNDSIGYNSGGGGYNRDGGNFGGGPRRFGGGGDYNRGSGGGGGSSGRYNGGGGGGYRGGGGNDGGFNDYNQQGGYQNNNYNSYQSGGGGGRDFYNNNNNRNDSYQQRGGGGYNRDGGNHYHPYPSGGGGGGGGGGRFRGPKKEIVSKEDIERCKCIFVGNLPYHFQKHHLVDLFGKFGPLANVNVGFDRKTGRSRGYAFVEFESKADANNAFKEFSQQEVEGRRLRLDWDLGIDAKKQPPPPPPIDSASTIGAAYSPSLPVMSSASSSSSFTSLTSQTTLTTPNTEMLGSNIQYSNIIAPPTISPKLSSSSSSSSLPTLPNLSSKPINVPDYINSITDKDLVTSIIEPPQIRLANSSNGTTDDHSAKPVDKDE